MTAQSPVPPASGERGIVRTRLGNRRRIPNKCEVCGYFLRDADTYGDFHMTHHHPEEYEMRMSAYHDRQVAANG